MTDFKNNSTKKMFGTKMMKVGNRKGFGRGEGGD